MSASHLLAIDQGTTSTRAIVFDALGHPLASHQLEFRQHFPADGRVDVMISHATGGLAKLGFAGRLLRGVHHRHDDVQYLRAAQVTVSGDSFWISADGEISGPERHRSWHIEPAAYSFVLPRS